MKEIIYAGGYGENGLSVLESDTESGSIRMIEQHPALNASYIAVSSNKKYLYAVHEVETFLDRYGGGVSSYRIKEDGCLEFMNNMGTKGKGSCHVSINKKDNALFVSNYTEGTFCVFGLGEDGRIECMLQNIKHTGSSIVKGRQDEPHAHFAIEIPQTNKICVCDLGLDKVMVYGFDEDYINLTFKKEIVVKAGSGPRHIAFDAEKRVLYVTNELSVDITAYRYDEAGEEFVWIQDIPLAGGAGAEDSVAAIRSTKDNQYILASVRGKNIIVTYRIQDDGTLVRLCETDVKGCCPRDFCLNPQENLLYCGNQESNELVVFEFDHINGKLTDTDRKISLDKPVCFAFRAGVQ